MPHFPRIHRWALTASLLSAAPLAWANLLGAEHVLRQTEETPRVEKRETAPATLLQKIQDYGAG